MSTVSLPIDRPPLKGPNMQNMKTSTSCRRRTIEGLILILLAVSFIATPAAAVTPAKSSHTFAERIMEEGALPPNPETSEYYIDATAPDPSSAPDALDKDTSTTAVANPAGCFIRVENPVKVGSTIQVEAIQSCDFPVAGGIDAGLQQYRGLLIWRGKASDSNTSSNASVSVNVIWDCTGSGSQLYRGRAEGYYTLDGTTIFRSAPAVSQEVRYVC